MAHPDAERATVQAANAAQTLMVVSTNATCSLEDLARVTTGPLWFQLYIYNYTEARTLITRAEQAGYQAIVLTVDMPRPGKRERDVRNDFNHFNRTRFSQVFSGNANHLLYKSTDTDPCIDNTLTWDIIPWLRTITKLPIVLKGILTAEDARLAVENHVDGIIVSNHGGRQLDGAIASIDALPAVLQAVAGACEVFVDGGIRRGTDILKALALGARAVLVGRPILWGLAAQGQEGVCGVLEILRDELECAMALSGCPTIESITNSLVLL